MSGRSVQSPRPPVDYGQVRPPGYSLMEPIDPTLDLNRAVGAVGGDLKTVSRECL